MKKLTALVLTLSMLLSMLVIPMGATATELTGAERQAILSTPDYQYVDFSDVADIDLYAAYADITDYGRFNKSITGATDHFGTTEYNGETVFNWLPEKTNAGKKIEGTEDYYFKGAYSKALVTSNKTVPSYVMFAEDLLEEDGTKVTGYRYNVDANANPSVLYGETETARKATTITVKASHVAERFVEDGKNYAIIENYGIKHKIGPVDGSAYSANSVYLSGSDPTIAVGTTGNTLSLLYAAPEVQAHNYTSKDTAVGSAPTALLKKVQIKYADEKDPVTKYFIHANSVHYSNYTKSNAALTIVYAPKKDSWTAADLYGANRVTAKILNDENSAEHGIADVSALTAADITFDNPDILMPEAANVAGWINNRQDANSYAYGQRVTMANIPLEDKEVESFTLKRFSNYVTENIPTAIPVGTSATDLRQAFIPVTVKGASPAYDYFAYVGVQLNYAVLLGATVVDDSLQEKIDAVNAEIDDIDVEKATEEKCAELRQKIADLIEEGNGVILETDFDTAKLDAAEERIADEKAAERAKEIVNAPNVTQFPLSAATGANSRLFVKKGTESEIAESGYLEGIDFFGRLVDSAAAETDKYIAYSMEGETPAANLIFKQDEGGKYVEITHYEEETKKYYVNPDEKVIKIMKVDATEEYYGENAEAAKTLNGCTIDVPDGKYNSIGLLAGAGWLRPVTTTLIYEDGEVLVPSDDAPYIYYWSHENFRGAEGTDKYNYYIADWNYTTASQRGTFRYHNLADFSETTTRIGYKEFTVASDPSRVLKSVKFASGNTASPVSIISLWGNKATVAEKLAELEGIEVTDEATLEAAKAAIADFDTFLAELGYTVADLASYKAPYTALQAAIAEYEERMHAERLSQPVYAPIEMDFLNDLFATKNERRDSTKWIDPLDYRAYLGFFQQNTVLPMKRTALTNGGVISVDVDNTNSLSAFATLKDGRYTFDMSDVPYRMGPINEGVYDANGFTIAEYVTTSGGVLPEGETNILIERLDEKYTVAAADATSGDAKYRTILSGNFPINVEGATKVNVLTTTISHVSVETGKTISKNPLYTVNAKVHLDNGDTVDYLLLTAQSGAANGPNDSILFVPKNSETAYTSYATINNAVEGEVKTLAEMSGIELSDIEVPSAPTVRGASIDKGNLKGFYGEKTTKETVFYYENVILPESYRKLYIDRGTYTTNGYVSSFELVAPEGRTITSVEFMHDSSGTLRDGYVPAVNAYASGTGTDAKFLVPVKVAGLEGYDAYVRITRNCHHSSVLGMTAESTGAEVVASLNTLMANASTASDIEAIESMKAFIDGETVTYEDLSAESKAAYEIAKQKVNVEGTIALGDGENGAKTVTANIKNITGLAGKIFTLIIAFYDEDGDLIKAVPKQYTTTAVKNFSQTLTVENVPENTETVKGFIWKDFKTLIPLGEAAE